MAFRRHQAFRGSKALMEDYPKEEANSKKTKKTNTGKGKKSDPKNKK